VSSDRLAARRAPLGTRLDADLEVVIDSPLPPREAWERLTQAVADRRRIEVASAPGDRRIEGRVDEKGVCLWVRDSALSRRRKSWNIEFRGQLTGEDSGSRLQGMIGIRDRGALRAFVLLSRLAAGLLGLLAVVITARQAGAVSVSAFAGYGFALLVFGAALAGGSWLQRDGERAAADHARLSWTFLHHVLEADAVGASPGETHL